MLLTALGGGFLLGGCHSAPEAAPAGAIGPRLSSSASLDPAAAPEPHEVLTLAGDKIPVEVAARQSNGALTLLIQAHGSVFDREEYRNDLDSFGLSYAAGERYEPPIPLLRFPMNVGQAWSWKGTMTESAAPIRAHADVRTSMSKLAIGGTPQSAVQVEVALYLQENPQEDPKRRDLTFWFVEGKGVARREFGTESARGPAGD